jgi:hypothetical protein
MVKADDFLQLKPPPAYKALDQPRRLPSSSLSVKERQAVKIALLRVGIDSGSGGIQGPLFPDGSFDYVPIPEDLRAGTYTYGNTLGRFGRLLVDYFPSSKKSRMEARQIHLDPEFETFTYGDPGPSKAGLRYLNCGDLLVFYCGLEGWGISSPPGLYIMGYFEVEAAGRATDFTEAEIRRKFANNVHVRDPAAFVDEKSKLVLVKGSSGSRLLNRACLISEVGQDRNGRPLKVLSTEMQLIFGDFDGRLSFQRSPTRWVKPEHVQEAAKFVRSLE